jgi:hypothetical protein
MKRLVRLVVGDVATIPARRFAKVLAGGYACLFGGVLLVFLAPNLLGKRLITPIWALGLFLVLGTFAYVGIYAVSMFRRWFRALRTKNGPSTAK